jgi:flagellum-specific ATP synthase
MAGSGVGKSTLLGMISRFSSSDINVIALIGERGREVREFIEKDLGPDGLSRSIVIVATSDASPLLRLRGAFLATAYAEFFRDQGKKVLLLVDSLTRLAMAQREIGLAVGEPPSSKGYTPSVFSLLPRLLERAGLSDGQGSITAFYTVLVEGDDMNEPIADSVRGIVDGHIVLSRALANSSHFPAIEILESISRVMVDVTSIEHRQLVSKARQILATYKDAQDLISVGAYKSGQSIKIDEAISKIDNINLFLRQEAHEASHFTDTLELLSKVI